MTPTEAATRRTRAMAHHADNAAIAFANDRPGDASGHRDMVRLLAALPDDAYTPPTVRRDSDGYVIDGLGALTRCDVSALLVSRYGLDAPHVGRLLDQVDRRAPGAR